ncbi:MAG: ribbon-helix-helix domain-containing protein [Methylocella sp.]
MTKRPSLFAAKATQSAPIEVEEPESLPEIVAKKPSAKSKTRPPSREGKRVLSVYLTPEAWKQLRMLSLNLESSTQTLGEEAINLLFEKHRLNRIA